MLRLLPVVIGGLGGYAYFYFVGCANGSCPITSNPWSSVAYGALIGALFVFGGTNKPPKSTIPNKEVD
ncbi:MAG: hypothetical protein FJ217_11355 [Ignavibacteria bacterium]|nr:hypothetical protein [Ignavibacteria bacterium]